jgi:hypothetical protein
MKTAAIFFLSFAFITGYTQNLRQAQHYNREWVVSGSWGQSQFISNAFKARSAFPTIEGRVGLAISKPFKQKVKFILSLNIGAKFKGDRMYPPGSTPPGTSIRLTSPFNELEEAVNSNNHYFLEVPVVLQYSLFRERISVRAGGSIRHFVANNGYQDSSGQINYGPDFFSNLDEFIIMSTVAVKIVKKICLTGSYYRGLTKIYGMSGIINQVQVESYFVRSGCWQIGIEYPF